MAEILESSDTLRRIQPEERERRISMSALRIEKSGSALEVVVRSRGVRMGARMDTVVAEFASFVRGGRV